MSVFRNSEGVVFACNPEDVMDQEGGNEKRALRTGEVEAPANFRIRPIRYGGAVCRLVAGYDAEHMVWLVHLRDEAGNILRADVAQATHVEVADARVTNMDPDLVGTLLELAEREVGDS